MRLSLGFLTLLLFTALVLGSCSRPTPKNKAPANKVTPKNKVYLILGKVTTVTVKRGSKAMVKVPVTVTKGFHIQSNPASEKYLIPTTLKFEPVKGIKLAEPIFPKPKPFLLSGSTKKINTYDGKFEVQVPLSSDTTIAKGNKILKGKFRYQACDQKNCFFPKTIPVNVPVQVQ